MLTTAVEMGVNIKLNRLHSTYRTFRKTVKSKALTTELKFSKIMVVPSLVYNCENFTLHRTDRT